jgi:selenide,water dikinase
MQESIQEIKLTQFSHGAGCGCKIAPSVLDVILKNNESGSHTFDGLLVGNNSRDDAAVFDLGNGDAMISTTDFFMPIVDDPYDFGRIASANAISDVYAMGGKPLMAIAILGWPVDKIPPSVAARVIEGSRAICAEAGIPLAGGHSIDCPEPVFGLAVSGILKIEGLKKNNTVSVGDLLFLTKPLGVGILSTAAKKNILAEEDRIAAVENMTRLNSIGSKLGTLKGVSALTDVTGFGLLGHLTEMLSLGGTSASIEFDKVPILDHIEDYLEMGSVPGGTKRNWNSYGHLISPIPEKIRNILADPQTSGGLLVAVNPMYLDEYIELMKCNNMPSFSMQSIGKITASSEFMVQLLDSASF